MEECTALQLPAEVKTGPVVERNQYIRPFGLSWRSHTLFIVGAVTIGFFAETLLYGIVAPILPFILHDRCGLPHNELQAYSSSLLAAYAGTSVVCAPLSGLVADRFKSRKAPLIVGLAVLIVATILFSAGYSVLTLVVARCAQGAGFALVWTAGYALCFDTVGFGNMGKTLGTVLSFNNIGVLFSPPLGGLIYGQAGLGGVTVVAVTVVVVDLLLVILLIEKKVDARWIPKLSTLPDQSSSNIPDPEHHDTPYRSEESPLLGGEDILRYYYVEPTQNKIYRLAPILVCLRDSSLVVAIITSGVRSALLGAFDATIPLEANELFGFNAAQAGLFFVPLGCLRLAIGPFGGWAVDRYGSRAVAIVGYSFLGLVLVSFRLVEPEPRGAQMALYAILLALSGIGMAIVGTTGFVEAGMVVDKYHRRNPGLFGENGPFASLSGLHLMTFSIGFTLGPLLAGTLKDRIGYGNMNAVLGALAGITAVASFLWLGKKPSRFSNQKA